MLVGIGAFVVFLCVFGGYTAMGGHLSVLWQPFEFVIICGAALGAFIIGGTKSVLSNTGHALKTALAGPKYKKTDFVELLALLYTLFKTARSKGIIALEPHIDKPHESSIFSKFPLFLADHHSVDFLCDYLRIMSMGSDNPNQLETLIDEEIATHHAEHHQAAAAVQNIADGMPALGIVAAVLGVIKTMGAITEPPSVLGHLIGGALVGTFAGVFIAYGFIAPLATAIKTIGELDAKYHQCIRAGLLAHASGCAPAVSVEFARKALFSDIRPTFYELEERINTITVN